MYSITNNVPKVSMDVAKPDKIDRSKFIPKDGLERRWDGVEYSVFIQIVPPC